MVKRILQFLFRKPLLFVLTRLHGAPNQTQINIKLSQLLEKICTQKADCGIVLPITVTDKIAIISDVHKGKRDGADDFMRANDNYIAALNYYYNNGYTLVALGDIEELWENSVKEVFEANQDSIAIERKFVESNRFIKVFGNHDLYWSNGIDAKKWLTKMYGKAIPIYEGVVMQLNLSNQNLSFFLTHGHQGDKTSDGNKFSKWFVSNIWNKVQAYLEIRLSTPSKDFLLRHKHNKLMYAWSMLQKNTILITGHTHKPVFESMSHMERLNKELVEAKNDNNIRRVNYLQEELDKRRVEYVANEPYAVKAPTYFNTGCCCYNDGDITLLTVADEKIVLDKWHHSKETATTIKTSEVYVTFAELSQKLFVNNTLAH